ncbi:hypothetical protein [Enterococcus devriesei]|uniref:Uncharacterized protein n=1 Tax=Enterococcus devriesei TaxID=319970 RepID=A0A1L8STL6_9ENTE|nr:hypothetical protein RV00_GL002586 [Enterococcus devriesei]
MGYAQQYDWIDFYQEFATKLLQYKDNRDELVDNADSIIKKMIHN